MKLRISQDHIRFRFSDNDLNALAEGRSLRVSACAPWNCDVKLFDCEVSSRDSGATSFEAEALSWRLQISRAEFIDWYEKGRVSLKIDTPSGLELIIERDLGRKAKRLADSSQGDLV